MFRSRLFAGIALATAAFVAGASAQTAGIPDFSSNQAAWERGNGVNFTPVPGAEPPITNDPAHPYRSNGDARRLGLNPTYRIADLSNPNIKQWAKDVMKKDNDEVLAGKMAYTPGSSCRPSGVPVFMLDGGPFYFIQTPKIVYLIAMEDNQVRRIYIDQPHSKNPKLSWFGESVGHYEGDTLVIDTVGQNTKTFVDHFRTPHSDKLHVIERWRKIDNGKSIQVEVTVGDPDTFVKPWKGTIAWENHPQTFQEYKCVEGNIYDPHDWGIPVDNTPDF